jgi:hypothetical protein
VGFSSGMTLLQWAISDINLDVANYLKSVGAGQYSVLAKVSLGETWIKG